MVSPLDACITLYINIHAGCILFGYVCLEMICCPVVQLFDRSSMHILLLLVVSVDSEHLESSQTRSWHKQVKILFGQRNPIMHWDNLSEQNNPKNWEKFFYFTHI